MSEYEQPNFEFEEIERSVFNDINEWRPRLWSIFSLPSVQFEYKMVEISLKILDLNHKHLLDPADDVAARCNPIYVGRVVSAMVGFKLTTPVWSTQSGYLDFTLVFSFHR